MVFVDLPQVGSTVQAGEAFAAVESVKAVSDIYVPVSGRVVEVNEELADRPELINEDPVRRRLDCGHRDGQSGGAGRPAGRRRLQGS